MRDGTMIRVLAIVGATASGKTALGIELARRLHGEVVSADAMQVYEGMPIATAKPTEEEMQGVPHHLIGFVPRAQRFTVADYTPLAHETIRDIASRGKLPLLVGGTGLYVESVLRGRRFLPGGDRPDIRAQLQKRLEADGAGALYEELVRRDPEAAASIHPHNTVRVVRALEVCLATGMTFTRYQAENEASEPPYQCLLIGLAPEREVLWRRIERRVDSMLEAGLVDEAREVRRAPLGPTAAAAIGYKELLPYLDGEASLETCREKICLETRHYAKRQGTWFRRNAQILWLNVCENDKVREISEKAEKIIAKSNFL